ncbi:hypothetical protein MRB53_023454 [Persea americana]|uniref:Uncharacterized protein n=1 Tax=Persea americana TaxID=3435 RepID=A0ACC2L9F4_PERAE|nr:hypothetical protein MRB53_023454 [Persea americana]
MKEDSSAYHEILEMGLKEGLLQKVVKEICPLWAGSKEGCGVRFSSVREKISEIKGFAVNDLEGGKCFRGGLSLLELLRVNTNWN